MFPSWSNITLNATDRTLLVSHLVPCAKPDQVQEFTIYIKQKCLSVFLSVCLSVTFGGGWQGRQGGWTGRRGQWGGGISQMECLGGDTFPEQCQVTQLVNYQNLTGHPLYCPPVYSPVFSSTPYLFKCERPMCIFAFVLHAPRFWVWYRIQQYNGCT